MTTYSEGWRLEGFAVDEAGVGVWGLKWKDGGKGKGREVLTMAGGSEK
jgi:hypothetical protein